MANELTRSQKLNIAISKAVRNGTEWLLWRMTATKNNFSGKRPQAIPQISDKILICGNGPSAGRTDLVYYNSIGYEIMCVNSFANRSEQFASIKPKYYCGVDPVLYDISDDNEEKDENKQIFQALNNVSWKMIYVCLEGQYPPIVNPNIEIVKLNINRYYSNTPTISPRLLKKYVKNKATLGYDNVILACLFYAITAGAKKIALTGVETNTHKEFEVSSANEVYRNFTHFYGTERRIIRTFDTEGSSQILIWFKSFYSVFLGYNILSRYAQYRGISMINLTENSFIDVFPKEKLVEVREGFKE